MTSLAARPIALTAEALQDQRALAMRRPRLGTGGQRRSARCADVRTRSAHATPSSRASEMREVDALEARSETPRAVPLAGTRFDGDDIGA